MSVQHEFNKIQGINDHLRGELVNRDANIKKVCFIIANIPLVFVISKINFHFLLKNCNCLDASLFV